MASRSSTLPQSKFSCFLELAYTGNLTQLKRLAREFDNGIGLAKVYVSIKDVNEQIALHHAAAGGNSDICEYLVKKLKLDVDFRDMHGTTPLHLAVESHHISTVRCLVRLGADISLSDSAGDSALHIAAINGNTEIMEFLISKGANVNLIAGRTGAPLHRAVSGGKKEAVKLLLSHKANPNYVIHKIFTPLLMSMVAAESFECSELLLKSGADPNLGACGVIPLSHAVGMQDVRMVECLLKYGADPNASGGSSELTALETAALAKNREIMRILFPRTSRIESYRDWTIDGIVEQIHSVEATEKRLTEGIVEWKEKGKAAFQNEDYFSAIFWYTKGIHMSPYDETLLSNRSLCWARLNEGDKALIDAEACVKLRPDWSKAHYRRGSALKILRKYRSAAESFRIALHLEPGNKEIEKELREVMER